jgi:hypothetical protein
MDAFNLFVYDDVLNTWGGKMPSGWQVRDGASGVDGSAAPLGGVP